MLFARETEYAEDALAPMNAPQRLPIRGTGLRGERLECAFDDLRTQRTASVNRSTLNVTEVTTPSDPRAAVLVPQTMTGPESGGLVHAWWFSRRQIHPPLQILKAWVASQAVPIPTYAKMNQGSFAPLIRSLQPCKRTLAFRRVSIEARNPERRNVRSAGTIHELRAAISIRHPHDSTTSPQCPHAPVRDSGPSLGQAGNSPERCRGGLEKACTNESGP